MGRDEKARELESDLKISRRQFLKYLGAVAGTAAFVFSPLASLMSLDRTKGLLKSFTGRELKLEDVDFRESDPKNPSEGDIWYRVDQSEEGGE